VGNLRFSPSYLPLSLGATPPGLGRSALCPLPSALCSMLCALCSVLCALCPVLYALCSMPYALCSVPPNNCLPVLVDFRRFCAIIS
jgi:hypothetical protein